MPTVPSSAPVIKVAAARVNAVGSVADATEEIAVTPWQALVTGVSYTPDGPITGAATNNRLFNVVNRTQAGQVVASVTLVAGTNLVAGVPLALTLSGTAANVACAANDVLEFDSTHQGTGLADPGGLVSVTFAKNDTSQ